EVARHSARVMAGSGHCADAMTTHVLPVTMTGAMTETRPRSESSCGATMATTPVGSGAEMLKYGPATGLSVPATWATLSDQPAYQTQRSIAASTLAPACVGVSPCTVRSSLMSWSRRDSITSATR